MQIASLNLRLLLLFWFNRIYDTTNLDKGEVLVFMYLILIRLAHNKLCSVCQCFF